MCYILVLTALILDIELAAEDLALLEKAAKAHPPKRTVDPSDGWGLDIFEDAQHKSKL